jgi:Uma2 family endonuclease
MTTADRNAHPSAAVLVMEVADSTLAFDCGPKAALYAQAGIPDYWVLNLPVRVLLVHRDPDPMTGTYRQIARHGETDAVSPLAAPDAQIPVRELLP